MARPADGWRRKQKGSQAGSRAKSAACGGVNTVQARLRARLRSCLPGCISITDAGSAGFIHARFAGQSRGLTRSPDCHLTDHVTAPRLPIPPCTLHLALPPRWCSYCCPPARDDHDHGIPVTAAVPVSAHSPRNTRLLLGSRPHRRSLLVEDDHHQAVTAAQPRGRTMAGKGRLSSSHTYPPRFASRPGTAPAIVITVSRAADPGSALNSKLGRAHQLGHRSQRKREETGCVHRLEHRTR